MTTIEKGDSPAQPPPPKKKKKYMRIEVEAKVNRATIVQLVR